MKKLEDSVPRSIPIKEARAVEPVHELRVRIPVDLHRQLLSLKVLRGKSLAETVSQALDLYFAEHARRAPPDPSEDAAA